LTKLLAASNRWEYSILTKKVIMSARTLYAGYTDAGYNSTFA